MDWRGPFDCELCGGKRNDEYHVNPCTCISTKDIVEEYFPDFFKKEKASMPAYDYSCTANPEHRKDNVIFGINEYEEKTLKDKPCEVEGCDGTYEHTFENARPGHAFRGDGWTPKFHR